VPAPTPFLCPNYHKLIRPRILSEKCGSAALLQQFSFWKPARKQPAKGGLFSGFKAERSLPPGATSPL